MRIYIIEVINHDEALLDNILCESKQELGSVITNLEEGEEIRNVITLDNSISYIDWINEKQKNINKDWQKKYGNSN